MALNGDALGDLLKGDVQSITNQLNQSSDPLDADAYQTAFWRKIGNRIVNYFKANATIESLSCNQTPNDGAAHTHNVSTVESTGKIK